MQSYSTSRHDFLLVVGPVISFSLMCSTPMCDDISAVREEANKRDSVVEIKEKLNRTHTQRLLCNFSYLVCLLPIVLVYCSI